MPEQAQAFDPAMPVKRNRSRSRNGKEFPSTAKTSFQGRSIIAQLHTDGPTGLPIIAALESKVSWLPPWHELCVFFPVWLPPEMKGSGKAWCPVVALLDEK